MYTLHVLYNQPEDPAAFDKHYNEVHSKIAADIPGVSSYTAIRCAPGPDGAAPPYYMVATLEAESEEALNGAMSTEQGQAATADLPNFAGAGVAFLAGDSTRYV